MNLVFLLFPLDCCRWFRGNVVNYSVDSVYLGNYVLCHFLKEFERKVDHLGGDCINGVDCPEGDDILEGAAAILDSGALYREEDSGCLPDLVIEAGLAQCVDVNGISLLKDMDSFRRAFLEAADTKARARERMTAEKM